MSIVAELEALKKKLETLSAARQKELGRYEQLLEQLKGMGIESYEAGRQREAELEEELRANEAKARELIDKVTEEFGEYL